MKIGITLPQFRDEADSALDAARLAESLGIDGVFCFDHLWPIGQPGRPVIASWPLLGAIAASTSTVHLGSMVARVGLLPDPILVEAASSVADLSGGRFIAGLGTGDRLSREENEAYGIPFLPADERRAALGSVAEALTDRGVPVWVGGASPPMLEIATSAGAAVNLWDVETEAAARLVSAGHEVTWGGPVGDSVEEAASRLSALAAAGVSWAVCAWPESIPLVVEAAEEAGRRT